MSEKKKDEQDQVDRPDGRAAAGPDFTPDRGIDESPIPGGCTIRGGRRAKDGKHYGGVLQDANGNVLDSFQDDEENTGIPRRKAKPEGELSAEQVKAQADQFQAERDQALKTVADQQTQLQELQDKLQRAEEDARMTGFAGPGGTAEEKAAPKKK